MRYYLLLLLPLLFSAVLVAQETDTVTVLPEIAVTGFREAVPRSRVAASIGTVGPAELARFSQAGFLPAVNRLAGVRFEERAPGSYRISVRGSTLRSPFGVRNLKVYWNDIPLTQPGGDTPFNFLDPTNVDRLELIKGPAGSLYGAGTAGAMLMASDGRADTARVEISGGSYGFRRLAGGLHLPAGRGAFQLRYATQSAEGYRDHSAFARQVVQLSNTTELSDRRRLSLHALYTRLRYELPGGLNPEQYAADPTQARPGSADKNASVNYDNLLFGATQDWRSGRLSNRSTLYGTFFYFRNPFNVDYKRETNLGGGGRSVLDYVLPGERSVLKFSAGVEHQLQFRMAQNFTNPDGDPGELNFSDEVLTHQTLLFGQATLSLPGDWRITAGLSTNNLRYVVDRTFDATAAPAAVTSDFPWEASPRLAVLKGLGGVNVYASVSAGFSPPTLSEFRTNEGSINTTLNAERGVSYELGLKRADGHRLGFEVAAFYFRLEETITSFADARGTQLFRNAGNTDQRGLEVSADWLALTGRTTGALRRLDLSLTYAYHDFTYGDYVRDNEDFSGNPLPGTAPQVLVVAANATFPSSFYANLSWNRTAAIPLNDANTVFADGYDLVRLRMGVPLRINRTGIDLYAGADNLLNQRFSLGSDLNPQFGNRYFQPSPDRTWYVGMRLQY